MKIKVHRINDPSFYLVKYGKKFFYTLRGYSKKQIEEVIEYGVRHDKKAKFEYQFGNSWEVEL